MDYFDIVPAKITLNTELSLGARVTWIVIRRWIQEGDRHDRRTRSRRIKVWELAGDLGVSTTATKVYLGELQKADLIDQVRGSHNGNLIMLKGEHGVNSQKLLDGF